MLLLRVLDQMEQIKSEAKATIEAHEPLVREKQKLEQEIAKAQENSREHEQHLLELNRLKEEDRILVDWMKEWYIVHCRCYYDYYLF